MSPVTRDRRRAVLRLALFALAIAAGFAAVTLAGFGPDDARRWVDDAGRSGPLVFVLVAAALGLVLFPGHVTAAAAGVLFGAFAGTGLMLAAAVLGLDRGVAARAPARRGRAALAARPARPAPAGLGERERLRAVLASRLAPGVPASVVNYLAGLSGIRTRAFVAAVALGALPKTIAYVALGGALSDPVSTRGAIAVALYVVAAAGGALVAAPAPGPRAGAARAGRAETASIEGGGVGEPAVHRASIGPVRGSGSRSPVQGDRQLRARTKNSPVGPDR